jgi:hypothetical protein
VVEETADRSSAPRLHRSDDGQRWRPVDFGRPVLRSYGLSDLLTVRGRTLYLYCDVPLPHSERSLCRSDGRSLESLRTHGPGHGRNSDSLRFGPHGHLYYLGYGDERPVKSGRIESGRWVWRDLGAVGLPHPYTGVTITAK